MTLRDRQKKKVVAEDSDVVVTDSAPAPPRKRQRRETPKATAARRQQADASEASSSRARKRPRGNAASPSKLVKSSSSLTTLSSEATQDLSGSAFANLPVSQPRTNSVVLGRPNSTRALAGSAVPTQDIPTQNVELKLRRKSLEDSAGIPLAELIAREEALKAKETAIAERSAALDRREEESKTMYAIAQGQRAADIIKILEDSFSCSLCFEVIACPYLLTPSRCGHTFCATCLLKWFFTHLHRSCGGWHEALECPLCRSTLPTTPEQPPRDPSSFPFAPNRLAEEIITRHIESLESTLESPESPSVNTSASKGKGKARARKEKSTAFEPIFLDGGEEAVGWKKGGPARKEWNNRERIGRERMNKLSTDWPTVTSVGFLTFQRSLGL
ncbi:hypothetical protein BDW22DRAFT_1356932 [Trametopsis cervina]|nr:hypothetical protein BDW22DRAFT_1356932 [Trametopsis cervina]